MSRHKYPPEPLYLQLPSEPPQIYSEPPQRRKKATTATEEDGSAGFYICYTLSPSYMVEVIQIEIPSTYVTSKQYNRWWFEINYLKNCLPYTKTSVPKSVFNLIIYLIKSCLIVPWARTIMLSYNLMNLFNFIKVTCF